MNWRIILPLALTCTACGGRTPVEPSDDSGNAVVDDRGTVVVEVIWEHRYRVGGVQIVLENGNGPTQDVMLAAVERFRHAAIILFEPAPDVEDQIWREIEEIRWDDDLVPPVGGTYDTNERSMRLEYHGCIVDPPLFELLALHYVYRLTGETTLPDSLVTWAEELSAANTELCAPVED